MVKITCTSCQKPLSLDETKLPPDKEVSFPCPVCKTKLTVNRRNLEGAQAAGNTSEPPPEAPSAPLPEEHHEDDGFGAKALIVGNDNAALRHAAKLVGFLPMHFATPLQARDYFMQEFPPLVILNPAQVTAPPLADFSPIISLTPADRRRAFIILVADGLRTFDGNAAFLYGVNLVVSPKDLGAFQQIYREASSYHERLYGAITAVTKSLGG
jgi:predicted RNA-binding Zn-ribbon protein involved in translation (DUF1610 family)